MPKASSTIQPQHGSRPRGKIEVLPNAIHSITVQATLSCYGVLGIASPHLRYGHAVLLTAEQSNQGVQLDISNDQIAVEVFVVLEYGLRISEIAHNIMSNVKFSIENMLGIPVTQVNVNVQGLIHGPNNPRKIKGLEVAQRLWRNRNHAQ
ncbi:MAG TPA: Asp23/Gls24 family envelope stress response protein [Dictyobacter sp.]|nr:Asp23/Gls24 family envelope stress response protein [Dictyobacter sp.]